MLATTNEHKVEEILTVFRTEEVLPRPQDLTAVDESDDTLYGNALLKARAVCSATGQPSLADDTGLEICHRKDILGARTARFEPEAIDYSVKMAAVLDRLKGVPIDSRSARFITVALAYFPDGTTVHAEGQLEGHIAENPKGKNGFGYDPIFVPNNSAGRSYAEMTFVERVRISHRTLAFRRLRRLLESSA